MTLSPVSRTAALALVATTLSVSAAHAAAPNLVSAAPAAAAGYGPWPKRIQLKFDQPVAKEGLEVSLMDPDGRRFRLGAPARSGNTVTVALPQGEPPALGPYLVSWQARSTAGDTGKGDYTFFVGS